MKAIHLFVFVVTLGFTLFSASDVNANTHETQRYITQFKVLDADAQSKRLEGRLRANIAFNKTLSKESIEVNVEQDIVHITGEVSSPAIEALVYQEALTLFAEHQIRMQLQISSQNQVLTNQSSITAKLAGLFN